MGTTKSWFPIALYLMLNQVAPNKGKPLAFRGADVLALPVLQREGCRVCGQWEGVEKTLGPDACPSAGAIRALLTLTHLLS